MKTFNRRSLLSSALLLVATAATATTAGTMAAAPPSATPAPGMSAKRWNDDQLVASYRDFTAPGGLEAAVRAPTLPKDPPRPGFLDALAWYAAGMPDKPGTLTLRKLDRMLDDNVRSYIDLLKGKVEGGESNDYPRTRTWKLVQKLTLLRGEMTQPQNEDRYSFTAGHKAPEGQGADAWDRDHTLGTQDEFGDKVCRASYSRPVLVKYGNTNCTQCMLFEIIGSVKAFAEGPAAKGAVDVYKIWWGFRPDDSFAGRIREPGLLNDLAKTEGVTSSPYFIVYRNGRRYPCGDAFPDEGGRDERLETCIHQEFGEAPGSATCAAMGITEAAPPSR